MAKSLQIHIWLWRDFSWQSAR